MIKPGDIVRVSAGLLNGRLAAAEGDKFVLWNQCSVYTERAFSHFTVSRDVPMLCLAWVRGKTKDGYAEICVLADGRIGWRSAAFFEAIT